VPRPLATLLAALALVAVLFAPASARAEGAEHAHAHAANGNGHEVERLDVPGQAPAYVVKPEVGGLAPVLMFLHGRGGNPAEDCRKWARVATVFGWVVCPQGPDDLGGGARSWDNNAAAARQIIDATVTALRAKYKHRVQLRHNILIGFSEGAYIAMQVGLKDPTVWDRWLILAANDQYWWGDATKASLEESSRKVRRVYLYTGENDEVAENTKRVGDILKKARIPVRVNIATGIGHEVPADKMITNYRRPLRWLMAAQ